MKSDHEIWNFLSNQEFVGRVLRYSILLEFDLDTVIAQYFIRSDRYGDAMEVLLPELSFGRKLDLLSRLPIRKTLLSYQQAISGLRRFQRLRNVVAHTPHVSFSKAKSLSSDGNYWRILHGYPEGMEEEFRLTRRSLSRLLRIREFRNPRSNEVIDPWKISLESWLT